MINEILKAHSVLVCVGSGGVGKTTCAAALGVQAARMGMNVLVLTIDPSQRLGTSLGIAGSGGEDILVPNQNFSGKLYAALLNSKLVFDNFVREAVGDEQKARKFIANRLYSQLSTKLSSSQEFTALERLYISRQSQIYDLIILDTPPTKHAMDFLRSPQKINAMFQRAETDWFLRVAKESKSFFSTFSASQQVINIFRKLTGSNFIDELIDFFVGVENWQNKILERTVEVHNLLVARETGFILVTGFDALKLQEAIWVSKELRKGHYKLAAVIVNRAFPLGLSESDNTLGQKCRPENREIVERLLQHYQKYLKYESQRLGFYKQLQANLSNSTAFLQIPDLNQNVGNIRDLERLTDVAFK